MSRLNLPVPEIAKIRDVDLVQMGQHGQRGGVDVRVCLSLYSNQLIKILRARFEWVTYCLRGGLSAFIGDLESV